MTLPEGGNARDRNPEPARSREADARGFHALFAAHFEPLFRYALRFVRSPHVAEDVVHDVFLRLWQQRERVDLAGNLRAYLYAAVRHRALDHLKRETLEIRHGARYAAPALLDAPAGPSTGEEQVADDETAAAIQRAVDMLPARQREVILLRWRRQLSHAEIATVLGISAKTVAIHMGRAVRALRETLPRLLE